MKTFDASFSRKSLSWLWQTVVLFKRSPMGGRAVLWSICLLVLMLCINAMNVINSYVLRYFMSSIETHDKSAFIHYAWVYAGVFAISTVIAVYFRFAEQRLGLLWRSWLTRWLSDSYLLGKIYLHFQDDEGLSNPDQRISEDVNSLATTTLSFVLMFLNSTITIVSFASVLWTISPSLFLVAVAYSLVGSWLTVLLGRPLIKLNYAQQDFEANFRAELVHIRQAADGIALSGNEGRIRERLQNEIDQLVGNSQRIIAVNRNLGFLTTGYNYLIQLIPILIVAPMFISEGFSFGIIGQSAMAFSTLVAALSLIVSQFQSISSYASVLTRLVEFSETGEAVTVCHQAHRADCSSDSKNFVYHNLTLRSMDGDGTLLIEDLNITIEKGKNLLITGPKQAAKKALFLATAGIHVPGSGCIDRTPPDRSAFLPEKAFLPPGPLREVLVSAGQEDKVSEEEILQVLNELDIAEYATREGGLNSNRNWHDVLSLQDEQLMGVARVLIAHPDFVFLDHISATLDENTERKVFRLLKKYNITYISISTGSRTSNNFDTWLELKANGTWKWTDLKPELQQQAK